VLRHCLDNLEIPMVLQEMHERVSGGHLSSKPTILQNLGCQILVAHDAKGCYEILPSL